VDDAEEEECKASVVGVVCCGAESTLVACGGECGGKFSRLARVGVGKEGAGKAEDAAGDSEEEEERLWRGGELLWSRSRR